ncbi:MAG TPA: YkgJ family cysteine cluster protein [Sinorhizobium sp.]|nr:YkgJ family cysteine cluster protein [Sinorhizobium sp.]
MTVLSSDIESFDCQRCGACCTYSADWPRFSLETDEELDRIPAEFVATDLGGMRCENDRCTALAGTPGGFVACKVYAMRPIVCRTCMPGDDECLMARDRLFGATA